jgi:hypothetical protein
MWVWASIVASAASGWAATFAAARAHQRGERHWVAYFCLMAAVSWFYSNSYLFLRLTDISQGEWSQVLIRVSPFAFLYAWVLPSVLWIWEHPKAVRK